MADECNAGKDDAPADRCPVIWTTEVKMILPNFDFIKTQMHACVWQVGHDGDCICGCGAVKENHGA